MPKKLQSERQDKRGHWPKGKRRNEPPADWPKIRIKLARLLRNPERGPQDTDQPVRSIRGLSRALAISERQIGRWLASDDMPNAERVEQIKTWMTNWA